MFTGDKDCKFDTSGLAKDHPMYDPTNNKEFGKGVPIAEIVCISAKMYALRSTTLNAPKAEIDIRKCKGISKGVVKKKIRFQHYMQVLGRFL
jgi:hypothetical protein